MQAKEDSVIVFFDGYCNLCNSTVDLLMKIDRKSRFKYASLQGETAKDLDLFAKIEDADSVVLYEKGEIYVEMDAAIAIASSLGFPYNLITVIKILPRSWRNRIYRFVARNRYRWFGKKDSCRMPTEEERSLFLD
ncbi:DUF393 domain-containing protein [bacterium]|nr:DUF393 domain-containing protein [bacterium]